MDAVAGGSEYATLDFIDFALHLLRIESAPSGERSRRVVEHMWLAVAFPKWP